jgi:predicted GH43/DUF377 family glycosyl hydrolase
VRTFIVQEEYKKLEIDEKYSGYRTQEEQTPEWEWGIFDLPGNSNRMFLNPTISNVNSNKILWVRRTDIYNYNRIGSGDRWDTCVEAYNVNDFDNPKFLEYTLETEFDYEQMEDPRVLVEGDKYLVTCASFVGSVGNPKCVKMYVMNMNGVFCYSRIIPYGYNGKGKEEKNWVFFKNDNKNYFVYKSNPFTVVEVNSDWSSVSNEHITDGIEWEYGKIRGGTNPVFYDGQFWSFFHSSLSLGRLVKKVYFMGWYSFEAKPPFKITGMSENPILTGNFSEDTIYHVPPWAVVFPGGSYIEDDVWVVVYGYNDVQCRWMKIPHKDLK